MRLAPASPASFDVELGRQIAGHFEAHILVTNLEMGGFEGERGAIFGYQILRNTPGTDARNVFCLSFNDSETRAEFARESCLTRPYGICC